MTLTFRFSRPHQQIFFTKIYNLSIAWRQKLFFLSPKFIFWLNTKFLSRFISLFVEFCVYLRYEIRNINYYTHMKELARNIGVVVMLIGVAILVIPFLTGATNNTNLIIGLVLVIEGLLGHIYVNNMKKGSLVSNIIWAIILLIVPYAIFFISKRMAYSHEEIAAYN